MGRTTYDAVIVGARVAGTPAAQRLAERGWKVLLLDREPPPADTLSTHDGYEAWRADRAREHYEWSFDFARFANPQTADPIFRSLVADPQAGQDQRNALSRQLRPKEDVFTRERLERWFSAAVPSA